MVRGRKAVVAKSTFLTFQEVCEMLSVSRSTLNQWRSDGRFPEMTRLPNGSLVIRTSVLDEWIDGLVMA
jgi:excisionase family DNA binding protein